MKSLSENNVNSWQTSHFHRESRAKGIAVLVLLRVPPATTKFPVGACAGMRAHTHTHTHTEHWNLQKL